MQFYVKHATLINNCYPEKDGDIKPRASELSYLTFYASSKPAKLTKVGSFLEKKVERDAVKGRKQNNLVTLEIVKALIEACQRDLNLFSKYVVKIIDMMSVTNDIETIDLACQVFIVFAEIHDGSTLGVDEELTMEYEALLNKYAEFCFYENTKDDTCQLQMRYIGQRGLQAAIKSNALQATNFYNQLDIILLPITITLSQSKNAVDALARSEEIDISRPVFNHETLNAHSIDILAAKSIGQLFNKANAASVRLSIGPLFSILDKQEKWWPANFVVSMMELVLCSLQPQFRYLLVPEMLHQIDILLTSTNQQTGGYIEKYASLVSILDTILNAHMPLVGISVLEVLNSLFILLIKSVRDFHTFHVAKPPASDVEAMLEYTIQFGLTHSIGGLASETYYLNQLNDITGYIISKLKIGNSVETVDGLPLEEYRTIVLSCLDQVTLAASNRKKQVEENVEDAAVYRHVTTLDVWMPAIGLLTDKSPETRVNFALALVHYIEAATTENEVALDPYPKHTMTQQGDISFVNSLHQMILDWIQITNLGAQDVRLIHQVLVALLSKFGADEVIKGLPFIFKIQQLVKQLAVKPSARQRAVAAIVVEWLAAVASMYRISNLTHYIEGLKRERVQLKEYSPVFLNSHYFIDTFEELEPDNTTPVDKFVDRKRVVDMLVKDGPLRDSDDVDGADLENKLLLEWGTDNYANSSDRTFRIRTSRNMSDLKVKLSSTPWSSASEMNMRNDFGKKQSIRVENLKDVLAGLVQPQQQLQQSCTIQSLTATSLSKRPDETASDINQLLQSLFQSNDVVINTTSSLVNPPYK